MEYKVGDIISYNEDDETILFVDVIFMDTNAIVLLLTI